MKILVISSCSSTQKHNKLPNRLGPEDFTSSDRLVWRMKELSNYKEPAAEMYEGRGHEEIMKGLRKIRRCYGREIVDLSIVSTGYGLINECCVIVPYDVPNSMSPILNGDGRVKLHQDVETLIKDYELVFFFLGEKYVRALQLPFEVPDSITQIFLLGDTHRKLIPDLPNTRFVSAGEPLRDELNTTHTALKGVVFKKICERVCCDGLQVFEQIMGNPQLIPDIARGT